MLTSDNIVKSSTTSAKVALGVACVAGGIREHKGGSLKYRLPEN